MLDKYEEESGFRPSNESDVMLRMRVLAGEIYNERAYAEYIMRQMFPSTAEGEYLDAHAAQRGLSRKNGTKAAGAVTFTAASEEHEDILIPAGTEVCTKDGTLRYISDRDTILRDGVRSIYVYVTASKEGSAYNAVGESITILVTPVLGIESVKNPVTLSGGTDTETDEQLRERITDSYLNISNGANAAYYRSIAMSVDGVYSASAVGRVRGAGTVNVYACGRGGTLSSAKLNEIQALLDEKREVNVDVKVYSPSAVNIDLYIRLTVSEGYDFDTIAENVKVAVADYINDLGIGHSLWLADVGEVIYHIEGVAGYRFLESYGSDREISQSRYAKAGVILVRSE